MHQTGEIMNSDTELITLGAELERLKGELARKDAEIQALKTKLQKVAKWESEIDDERRAMIYMLEDLNNTTKKLEIAKREWETTFDAVSDPIFIHDKQFKIVRANKAYAEAAGIPLKDITGKLYYEFFPKINKPFKMCQKMLELQEEEVDLPYLNKIFKVRFYPIRDVEGKFVYSVHIMEDITEVKRSTEKLRQEMEITADLLTIAEITSHTIEITKRMEQVMQFGSKIVGCDICLSYLWNKEMKIFQPDQCHGLPPGLIPVFHTQSLDEQTEFVKRAIEEKKPVVISVAELNVTVHPHPNLPPPPFSPSVRGTGGGIQVNNEYSPPLVGGVRGGGELLQFKGEGLRTEAPQSRIFPWFPDFNTSVLIPLIGREGCLGFVVAIFKNPREFTEKDMRIISGISNQVSIALEQEQLYKESVDKTTDLSHKIETINVMHEIDRGILSTLDTQEILETISSMVTRLIPAERVTVVLVDRERGGFIYKAGFGVKLAKGTFVPFNDTSATEVIQSGMPQFTLDLASEKDLLPLERALLDEGYHAHIRVPLTIEGEIVGLFNVGSKKVGAFVSEHLTVLERLAAQTSVALKNARLVTELKDMFLGTANALSSAIDAKSPWTAGHSKRVTRYALDMGKEMGLHAKDLKDLEMAGLLHDIGKLGTYQSILDKSYKLTEMETKVLRLHTAKGAEILSPIKQMREIIPAIRHHHEFYNGEGYPDGLRGEAIPLMARILGVADSVDAMSADRPYRKGKPMNVIIAELKRCSGTQFDPKVAGVFVKIVEDKKTLFNERDQ